MERTSVSTTFIILLSLFFLVGVACGSVLAKFAVVDFTSEQFVVSDLDTSGPKTMFLYGALISVNMDERYLTIQPRDRYQRVLSEIPVRVDVATDAAVVESEVTTDQLGVKLLENVPGSLSNMVPGDRVYLHYASAATSTLLATYVSYFD